MGQLAEIKAVERQIFALVRSYLEGRRHEIAVSDLDTATFICVTAVETLTHEVVTRRPDARLDEQSGLVEQVTRLVVGYLRPPRPVP